ncbi:MAG: hypothetical protein K2X03_17450 [Bryobacteraceae bacterium]|nr:hypothetical protein [Bryobacteraceae bacterium]
MHRSILVGLLGVAAAYCQAPALTISPSPVTQCNARGQGTAQLSWRTSETSVQVRIGSATGPAMTGFEPGNGGAPTGDWVSDGLVFVLVNPSGNEVARATARVSCQAPSSNLADQLATQSYFPLEVGNRWVYRVNDRLATGLHKVRWVDRTVQQGGETWFVVRSQMVPGASANEVLWRVDASGRIYRRRNNVSELYLDPGPNQDASAAVQVQGRNVGANTPIGRVTNAVDYLSREVLLTETGTYARGIGLVASSSNLIAGSSGGFSQSLQLVDAFIAGGVRLVSPANGLELSPESQTLDVVGRTARNCALPCYFVACGLGGAPPDPPGTYKPCLSTRVKVQHPSARSLVLELLNSDNEAVHSVTRPVGLSPDEQMWFETIPFYRPTGIMLPLGDYQLRATVKAAGGETINSSMALIKVQ